MKGLQMIFYKRFTSKKGVAWVRFTVSQKKKDGTYRYADFVMVDDAISQQVIEMVGARESKK